MIHVLSEKRIMRKFISILAVILFFISCNDEVENLPEMMQVMV